MKLIPVLPPQACEFEALKYGLTQYNEGFTGTVFREKIAAFVKNDEGLIVAGVLGGDTLELAAYSRSLGGSINT